jgi:hypothetical protein
LSVSISARSSVLVVSSLLFALVVSVTSSLVQVLESLVGVVEGGFGLGDVVVNAGQLGLDVSQIGLGSEEGHAQKVAGSLVSLDSLVLSESLQIKGLRNLVEQLVAQFDDSSDCTLISQLGSLAGNGGQHLEQFSICLSVDELAHSLGVSLEMLLDQSSSLSTDFGISTNLSLLQERSALNVISEDSSGFSNDGGGFLVLSDFAFKHFSFFSSLGINIIDVSLVASHLLLFGAFNALEDLSLGIKRSL